MPLSMSHSNMQKLSKPYVLAQGLFWGGYFLLNIIFMGLWGASSPFLTLLFILLSCLLGAISHGLRYLYKTHTQTWSLMRISMNLAWLLPLLALAAQVLLTGILFLILQLLPQLSAGTQPVSTGRLFSFAMNFCIMLTLWCTLYLLRAEFNKRRNTEIAHWQLQAQLKENELQFLRSQINSHFLFNAINNLRTLINEDAEAARAGLANLSILLRGLLQNDATQLVSLREEMEWVRGYLSLEALQFENRLTTSINVDDSLMTAKLPALVMQTLVENAIKHGIAARRAGGLLQIDIARTTPNRWQIKVTNPAAEFQTTHQGNKIGLRNARERLQIAFGDNANLNLQLGNNVIATVEMPL
jgi:sensor histidine kinase YesM